MVTAVDVVVLGATGFTGKLVTRYLQAHPERASGKFTYAIAGRSKQKLAELVADLKLNEPGTPERDVVQTFVVDTLEYSQVEEVVKNCKVIINTVGPFWKYSTNVVKACAHNGVHYVDTSGEVPWAKDLIHDFDYIAHKTRAIIVPFCGFDSIPSDISAYLSVRTLKTKVSPKITAARSITGHKVKGGVSGGTIATGISFVEELSAAKLAAARDPYAICPIKGTPVAAPSYLYSIPQTTPPIRGGFWVMGETNSAVVRRSWALQEVHSHCLAGKKDPNHAPYGPDFTYEEFMITPGTMSALMASISMGIGMAAMAFTPTRWILKKFLPNPGQGPSETVMQNGFVKSTNVTSSTVTAEFPEVVHAETIIRGKGDPGYLLTALMVSESALTLFLEHSRLTEYGRQGGLLTPMTAMGDVLIERLKNTGRFEFSSGIVGAPKDT